MSKCVDCSAYFQRIGYQGSTEPTLETLSSLAAHHIAAIPFENCSVLLKIAVNIDPESLHEKLVVQNRGGYCFEQNGYMLGLLSEMGYEVRPMAGRVRADRPRELDAPRTHVFLLVKLDGEEWIFDTGVGALSLSKPIRFVLNDEQPTLHETRRIVFENNRYYHQAKRDGDWIDVYEFLGDEMPLIDREVANWWTSTHPQSRFSNFLFCALGLMNGERKTILNNTFQHRSGSEILRTKEHKTNEDVMETLALEFGLTFEPGAIVPCPGLGA